MRLYDVPWISHEGGNIFSLDIHPSGSKLATAGQDGGGAGLLIVWDLDFLKASIDEATEVMPAYNNHPMARIPHSSSINCVRWTRDPSAKRLVCGGDDPVLCIYECTGVFTSMGSIDQPSSSTTLPSEQQEILRKVENYRCTHKLFGHTLDVLHLDWSPDGKYLASCSLDNSIIIWNARKLPEKLTTLKQSGGGHSRGVKGLAWDPVGRFLATQAEDNTLKIWQTDSWTCVHTFSEPFAESAISTLFCRMDWSPDGCFLVAPCAMNNGGPTAKIFMRKDWAYSRDLVGFRKAVCAVRAHPHCFQRTNYSGTNSNFACFAIGSRDRSISIWLMPNFARPLVVVEKVFKDSVVDLSWCDLTLAASSKDGVVRILKFSDNEIGNMLSTQETASIIEKLYGIKQHNTSDEHINNNDDSFSSTNGIQNIAFPSSSDFGYTSICESLARRTAETTINSEEELFKVAFGREPPKRRVSMEMLKRFVRKAKRQKNGIEQQNNSIPPNGSEKSPHPCQNVEANGINSTKINSDRRFYKRAENSKERRKIFELPERKRLLIARIEKDSPINYIEVINNYPLKSYVEPRIARLCGYNRRKGVEEEEHQPNWTWFSRRHISFLLANRIWTAIATFDAHFLTFSTQTGRLIFDVCLKEQASFFQQLNLENLLIGGCGGIISVWNIPQRRQEMQQSIAPLFTFQNQQLISAILLPQTNNGNNGAGETFAGIDLQFSDLNVYRYLPNSNGWSKISTLFDYIIKNDVPDDIVSILMEQEEETQDG
uniref:Protein HIRA n=1 Tax=Meloidogyne incognita TaxID=6306 RepID=A0A914KGJ8_MELIC